MLSPAAEGSPTNLFFQGNAGEISDRSDRFQHYQSAGFGLAHITYRGFGGSSGTISEDGLITDAVTAQDWLSAAGIKATKIALFGGSLRSGAAVQLATRRKVGAVVLEAPYPSAADTAAEVYWCLPVRLLMRDQFPSVEHAASVTSPRPIVHGDNDVVIPNKYGQRLLKTANPPKEFHIAKGMGHEALFQATTWGIETAFPGRYSEPSGGGAPCGGTHRRLGSGHPRSAHPALADRSCRPHAPSFARPIRKAPDDQRHAQHTLPPVRDHA